MTDYATYRATLEGLEGELAKAEARVARLKAGIIAIRELISPNLTNVSVSWTDATDAAPPPGVLAQRRSPDSRLSGKLTMRELATIALQERGKPMRMREIYDTLIGMGLKYPRGFDVFKGSMAPTLNRETDTFAKVEQGLFTLVSSNKNHTAPSD